MVLSNYAKSDREPSEKKMEKSRLLDAGGKYDVLTRPSKRLIEVSEALHRASESLNLFRE